MNFLDAPMESDRRGWHIAVLIPARDEEDLLPRCLWSVATARAMLPTGVTSDVIVVSDGSTDQTVNLARTMLEDDGIIVSTAANNVGCARAMAARAALHRNKNKLNRCWLANTDADCEVPASWLLQHLRIAKAGYVAVTGIVRVHDFSEHQATVRERFRQTYHIEPDGTHPHVHGANLGVRADVYEEAGGWRSLTTAEDHDLWGRIRNGPGQYLSDARLQVTTSGRRVGRAPLGFAAALASHNL